MVSSSNIVESVVDVSRPRLKMQSTIEYPLFLCTALLCVVSGVLNCVLLMSPLLTLTVPDEITAALRSTYNSTSSHVDVADAELRHLYDARPLLFHTRQRYMRKTCFPNMDDITWTRFFHRELPQQSCTPSRPFFFTNLFFPDCSRRQYCLDENNILPQTQVDAFIGLVVILFVITFCYSVSCSFWPALADNIICDVQLCCVLTAVNFIIKSGIVIGENKAFFSYDEMNGDADDASHYGPLLSVTAKTYNKLPLVRLTIITELITVLFQLRLTMFNLPRCQCQRCHRRRRQSDPKLPVVSDLADVDESVCYPAEKLPLEIVKVALPTTTMCSDDGKKILHDVEKN